VCRLGLVAVAAIVLLALPHSAAVARGAEGSAQVDLTPVELETIDQINAIRAEMGLDQLSANAALSAAATEHNEQMAIDGYFGHQRTGGQTFAQRIESYYPDAGASIYAFGENLLWAKPPLRTAAIVARWMRSPEHRANLLDPTWRQLGVSVITVPSAPGVFDHRGVTLVTVDFGVRRY
jgi:uncharacterized protein YkwD